MLLIFSVLQLEVIALKVSFHIIGKRLFLKSLEKRNSGLCCDWFLRSRDPLILIGKIAIYHIYINIVLKSIFNINLAKIVDMSP